MFSLALSDTLGLRLLLSSSLGVSFCLGFSGLLGLFAFDLGVFGGVPRI
jgi:hypothetical protein